MNKKSKPDPIPDLSIERPSLEGLSSSAQRIEGSIMKLSVDIPKELHIKLKVVATQNGKTIKEYVANLIEKAVEK